MCLMPPLDRPKRSSRPIRCSIRDAEKGTSEWRIASAKWRFKPSSPPRSRTITSRWRSSAKSGASSAVATADSPIRPMQAEATSSAMRSPVATPPASGQGPQGGGGISVPARRVRRREPPSSSRRLRSRRSARVRRGAPPALEHRREAGDGLAKGWNALSGEVEQLGVAVRHAEVRRPNGVCPPVLEHGCDLREPRVVVVLDANAGLVPWARIPMTPNPSASTGRRGCGCGRRRRYARAARSRGPPSRGRPPPAANRLARSGDHWIVWELTEGGFGSPPDHERGRVGSQAEEQAPILLGSGNPVTERIQGFFPPTSRHPASGASRGKLLVS